MTRPTLRAGLTAAAVAAALTLVGAACGSTSHTSSSSTMASSGTTAMASSSSTTASGGSTASSKADVQIVNFMFKPMAVTIKVGGTVTWKQVDAVGHSVESTSTPPAWTTSPVMKPGQTFSHTFTKAGTYNYICGVHNYMTGKIVVTG